MSCPSRENSGRIYSKEKLTIFIVWHGRVNRTKYKKLLKIAMKWIPNGREKKKDDQEIHGSKKLYMLCHREIYNKTVIGRQNKMQQATELAVKQDIYVGLHMFCCVGEFVFVNYNVLVAD